MTKPTKEQRIEKLMQMLERGRASRRTRPRKVLPVKKVVHLTPILAV
jgi:hypothetical protein